MQRAEQVVCVCTPCRCVVCACCVKCGELRKLIGPPSSFELVQRPVWTGLVVCQTGLHAKL